MIHEFLALVYSHTTAFRKCTQNKIVNFSNASGVPVGPEQSMSMSTFFTFEQSVVEIETLEISISFFHDIHLTSAFHQQNVSQGRS
jgi:hypothetical protein